MEFRKVRVIPDQHRQQRDQRDADGEDDKPDHPVNILIQPHKKRDPVMVPLRERIIELEQDRAADAELRQRQHRQDIGKQAVDAQIRFAQGPDEHGPDRELDQDREDLAADAGDKIVDRILRSGLAFREFGFYIAHV